MLAIDKWYIRAINQYKSYSELSEIARNYSSTTFVVHVLGGRGYFILLRDEFIRYCAVSLRYVEGKSACTVTIQYRWFSLAMYIYSLWSRVSQTSRCYVPSYFIYKFFKRLKHSVSHNNSSERTDVPLDLSFSKENLSLSLKLLVNNLLRSVVKLRRGARDLCHPREITRRSYYESGVELFTSLRETLLIKKKKRHEVWERCIRQNSK